MFRDKTRSSPTILAKQIADSNNFHIIACHMKYIELQLGVKRKSYLIIILCETLS